MNKLDKLDLKQKCRQGFKSCLSSRNVKCVSQYLSYAKDYVLPAIAQTSKINQGNVALKRVVESIANGDSHVPFRDSKLTMLLQVSFLCVSLQIKHLVSIAAGAGF